MTGLSLLPIFLVGFFGSVHCIGMCGGIVTAFSSAAPPGRPVPVAVVASGMAGSGMATALDGATRVLAYNVGRISSYATAGALAGGLVGGARALSGITAVQAGGYWLANLMLIAIGLYLMDAWHGLAHLESIGQGLWRRLRPLTKSLMPLDGLPKMLVLGSLWGWLPCGMVYSMLLTAMLTGSALSGATVMLAFGLGTLPTLLALGLLGARWRNWMQRRQVRVASGLLILVFGLLGLLRAANGLPASWLDAVCITHPGVGVLQ
ncbi:MAG: cytochrome biosis protein [Herminiimonas sp.]|nr:cytochrome biosis protein [Herminiimonas sp.]